MRTEQQLRDALQQLAKTAPNADHVRARLKVPASTRRTPARWRPLLIVATAGLGVVLVAAIALPYLTHRSASDPAEPADGRRSSSWTMHSQIDPPPGWSLESHQITKNYERTTLSDATGKGTCSAEIDRRGVAPQNPVPDTQAQAVQVGTQPALYQQAGQGQDAAVYWHHTTDAWASISCRPGPNGLGAAHTPQQIRDLILNLAETVTYGNYPLRLPIRLDQLPTGYRIQSAQQSGPIHGNNWTITLSPTPTTATTPSQVGTNNPTITISPVNGSVPPANTRVLHYPASFFTTRIGGPPSRTNRTDTSYTSLCIPTAPVGICIAATNTAQDEPNSRRDIFHTLANHITYAANPTDTTSWYDSTDALPD